MIRHFAIIPGQPVAKGRPRFSRNGHAYTPAKTVRWEKFAAMHMRHFMGTPMYDCPLQIQIIAVFQRPQNMERKKYSSERIRHTVRPDADNVQKAVCDALQLAGVVRDDSIICVQGIAKYYAAKGERAQTIVSLDGLDAE